MCEHFLCQRLSKDKLQNHNALILLNLHIRFVEIKKKKTKIYCQHYRIIPRNIMMKARINS